MSSRAKPQIVSAPPGLRGVANAGRRRDGATRAAGRWSAILWLLLLALLAPSPASAASDPQLSLGSPVRVEGALQVSLTLHGIFDREIAAALESGLPATLALRWQLQEKKALWGTRTHTTGSTWYRILYDVLEKRYDVFDATGRHVASCATLEEVNVALTVARGIHINLSAALRSDRIYFVELEARLEPLAAGEIEGLESWLHGDPEDSRRDQHSRGLSRYALGLMKDIVGMGARSAEAKSAPFRVP